MEESQQTILFFGRFHPVIVHLPIGFFLAAIVMQIAASLDRRLDFYRAIRLVLFLTCSGAVLSTLLGFLIARSGGYDTEMLEQHQWSGIVFTSMVAGLYLLQKTVRNQRSPIARSVYIGLFFSACIMVAVTGHYGGAITHGRDYLTEHMPPFIRRLIGHEEMSSEDLPVKPSDQMLVYKDMIQPLFDVRCKSCHNQTKKEGGLMLHSLEALMKGGDNGPVIKPGELPGSRLYACLLLPVDDKQRMPPKGRKQLSAGQIDLIRLWIADGASPVRKLSELAPEDTVKQLLSSLVSETLSPDEQFGDPVPAVAPDKLDMLADSGILVTEISRTGGYLKAWVRAEREVVTEGNMESLSELTEQLVWISFANKQIAPEAFAKLGRFRNLRRLDLANTNITDHDVQHIKGLNQLTYLNLYGTSVSDEGLKAIRSLQALRRLFLWQTNTSPSGVDRLIKDIAGLSVDTGAAAFPR